MGDRYSQAEVRMTVRHPARFSPPIVKAIAAHIPAGARVLDPMAGTGRVHDLCDLVDGGCWTVGVELEPEWAGSDGERRTTVGSSYALPFTDATFDAIATSPDYGNRLADHHHRGDPCKKCAGTGHVDGCRCPICHGGGLSERRSYAHDLGRTPHPQNSGVLHFGDRYIAAHRAFHREWDRVTRPGGRWVVNVSNFIRDRRVVDVAGWTAVDIARLGYRFVTSERIETRRLRNGANAAARVSAELVLIFDKEP